MGHSLVKMIVHLNHYGSGDHGGNHNIRLQIYGYCLD